MSVLVLFGGKGRSPQMIVFFVHLSAAAHTIIFPSRLMDAFAKCCSQPNRSSVRPAVFAQNAADKNTCEVK